MRQVKDSMLGQMRHVYSAYHGTGTVYAVVVTDNSGSAAAYVPALTYACNPACYTDSCQVLGELVLYVINPEKSKICIEFVKFGDLLQKFGFVQTQKLT